MYSSITPQAFDRMDERESHALAAEIEKFRKADFEAWFALLKAFVTAQAQARAF